MRFVTRISAAFTLIVALVFSGGPQRQGPGHGGTAGQGRAGRRDLDR